MMPSSQSGSGVGHTRLSDQSEFNGVKVFSATMVAVPGVSGFRLSTGAVAGDGVGIAAPDSITTVRRTG